MAPSTRLLRSAQRSLRATQQLPTHGFLTPALFSPSSPRRLISSTPARSASEVSEIRPAQSTSPNTPTEGITPPLAARNGSPPGNGRRKPLTREQRDYLSAALRVNQTGELAATLIYTAQTPIVVGRQPHLRSLMKHMYDQEVGHFETFNAYIAKHRIRPTAMYPVWSVLSYGMGWATAMMGQEAAMACTEAVETEIGDHYNQQVRDVLEIIMGWEAEGYEVGEEFRELLSTLRRIRDEELEHLDHAVEHDAKNAKPHWLLTGFIRLGCRGAIFVSEKV